MFAPLNRYLKTAGSIAAGLTAFQLVMTLRVFQSDRFLARLATSAAAEGYLAVPNLRIIDQVQSPVTACSGAFFFTLTLGALVCLAALCLARPAAAFRPLVRWSLPVLTLSAFLVFINARGLLMLESLACALAFGLVYGLDGMTRDPLSRPLSRMTLAAHLCPPLILAGVLLVFARGGDSRIFTDFRDSFLLTNPVGMAVNDFYYRYTLAPAEVFKSLDQKLIKQGHLRLDAPPAMTNRIARELLIRDYLPVGEARHADLSMVGNARHVQVFRQGRLIRSLPVDNLLKDPRGVFDALSRDTDRYANYRSAVGIALISGLPLLMYLMLHGFFFCVCALFAAPGPARLVASGLCLTVGLAAFVFLWAQSPAALSPDDIPEALASGSSVRRTAALRALCDQDAAASAHPQGGAFALSDSVPERYWYARSLAYSRAPGRYERLIALLDDPHPNVRCQAFFALGMSGLRRAVPVIIRRIEASDHWYVQWYAYRALKRLGWTQKRSGD
ncbi:hypothetical protein JCM14469_41840 [Desulfatiferula olefinivorans]